MGEHRKLGEDQYTVSRKVKRTKTRHMFLRSLQQPSTLAMKLTLAPIFPLFFAVSAFGNPVATDNAIDELDPRQLNCDIARKTICYTPPRVQGLTFLFYTECLQTIFTQTAGIIQPCGAALQSLEKVGEDILTGEFPPSEPINS